MLRIIHGIVADSSIRFAFFAFTLTRLLILVVILLSANTTFDPPVQDEFGDIHESKTLLLNKRPVEVLRRVTLGADSLWFTNIARNGYEKEAFNTNTQHTWAYFPLYPLLLRTAALATGEYPLTGMALSSLLFFFGLVLLYRLVIAYDYVVSTAERTVFYLAAFPVSYFFALAQTESLFLLLTVSCFYAARKDRWWLAGIIGAFASATRFAGIFLMVPLSFMYWQNMRVANRRLKTDVASLLLIPLGLIAFMIYLRSITGNAFAFADIQVAWGHSLGMFWRPLLGFLADPWRVSFGWDFRLLNFASALVALICGLVLLKRRYWALALYTLISVVVPLSFQLSLQSLARYVLVIFPLFLVLAWAGREPRIDQIIRTVFLVLLTLMSAMLAARVTLALS